MSLTHDEIESLYSDESVRLYRAEAVIARTKDGQSLPALCFNLLSAPAQHEHDLQYAAKLKALAERVGLPTDYVASIR